MAIDKEEILSKVSSYEILNHYLKPYHNLGDRLIAGKNISNPFLLPQKQETPSFNIFPSLPSHQWRYKDFATGEEGSCFDLVMNLFNLQFHEALIRINNDFNLGLQSQVQNESLNGSSVQAITEIKSENYSFFSRPFTQKELGYWLQYDITNEQLKLFNVLALESFSAVSKESKPYSQKSSTDKPIFAYAHEGWTKIYKPKDEKFRFQHLGNKPANFIFGLAQLPENGDLLFITGGEKDVMTLHAHGYSAISLNSETASIALPALNDLKLRFTHILLLYDNDSTGLKQSAKHALEHNLPNLVLPAMQNGKDISDFFKLQWIFRTKCTGDSAANCTTIVKCLI